MIASKIIIPREVCIQKKLTNIYSFHNFVYELFPWVDGKARDFVYLDKGFQKDMHSLLVISSRHPIERNYYQVLSKEIPEELFSYAYYRFDVITNPIRKHDRKEYPIIGRLNQGKWFLDKAEQWGFSVGQDELEVSNTFVENIKSNKHDIVQQRVSFSGRLTVLDRKKFKESVCHGIGKGKSFGLGLLEVVPIA